MLSRKYVKKEEKRMGAGGRQNKEKERTRKKES